MAIEKRKLENTEDSDSRITSENKRLRQTIQDCSDEFMCPITLKLPFHPVIAEDGRVYEREAIETWLNSSGQIQPSPTLDGADAEQPQMTYKSPVTNEPIGPRLVDAVQVRNLIEAMVRSDAVPADQSFEWRQLLSDRDTFNSWRREAESGDVRAMICLGVALRTGSHGVVRRNGLSAARWLTKALAAIVDTNGNDGAATFSLPATTGTAALSSPPQLLNTLLSSSAPSPSTTPSSSSSLLAMGARALGAFDEEAGAQPLPESSLTESTCSNNELAATAVAELRAIELEWCPQRYMDGQEMVTSKMRAILVDWIVEVHFLLGFKPETLHLTVSIVDRYGGAHQLLREKLQLVGVTALLMACKANNERNTPLPTYLAYLTANAYTATEVVTMEQVMSRHFREGAGEGSAAANESSSSSPTSSAMSGGALIAVPTAHFFLTDTLRALKCNVVSGDESFSGSAHNDGDGEGIPKGDGSLATHHRASFILECTLLNHDLLRFPPSILAAAAALLALRIAHRLEACSQPSAVSSTVDASAGVEVAHGSAQNGGGGAREVGGNAQDGQQETSSTTVTSVEGAPPARGSSALPLRRSQRSSRLAEAASAGGSAGGGAATALAKPFLSKAAVGRLASSWSCAAAAVSGYSEEDLSVCCEIMVAELLAPPQKTAQGRVLDAVHKKFRHERFQKVAEGKAAFQLLRVHSSSDVPRSRWVNRNSLGGNPATVAASSSSSSSSSRPTIWQSSPAPPLLYSPPHRAAASVSTISTVSTNTAHATASVRVVNPGAGGVSELPASSSTSNSRRRHRTSARRGAASAAPAGTHPEVPTSARGGAQRSARTRRGRNRSEPVVSGN